MTHTHSLGTVDQPSEVSIPRIISKLAKRGLQVERSFDLQTAREAHVGCTCPHHGTEKCDCQIVVLLVYGEDEGPITLVAHGRDGRTRFALVDHPDRNASSPLVDTIRHLFRVRGAVDCKEGISRAG